jgi:uncharacterized C2H2 Zn-finger protein
MGREAEQLVGFGANGRALTFLGKMLRNSRVNSTMISPTARNWIEACKAFARDPEAVVPCPDCGQSNLQVTDLQADDGSAVFERVMRCPVCGSFSAARMHRPG